MTTATQDRVTIGAFSAYHPGSHMSNADKEYYQRCASRAAQAALWIIKIDRHPAGMWWTGSQSDTTTHHVVQRSDNGRLICDCQAMNIAGYARGYGYPTCVHCATVARHENRIARDSHHKMPFPKVK